MNIDIITTKEFTQLLDKLYKLGGRNRNIHNKVRGLLGGIEIDGERAFKSLKVTNHGETRIKSCVKYDIGQGFRLITVHRNKVIWLLFIGDHEASVKWIKRNSGWTPIKSIDGEIRVVRETSGSERPSQNREIVPGDQSLIERFEDKKYYNKFLDLLPSRVALKIDKFNGNVSHAEITDLVSDIEDNRQSSCIQDVLISLIEDNKIQAQDRIDLYLGDAHQAENWSEKDYIEISKSDEFFSLKIGSVEYEKALNHMATKGTTLEWLLFMHPEQTEIVEKDYIGPVQLSGVSGSGKTCVALKRAIRLAELNPSTKVLLVSLNKSLVGLLKKLLVLSSPTKEIEGQITVLSMFELCQNLIVNSGLEDQRYYGEFSDILKENIDLVFREYYRCWLNNDDAKVIFKVHKMLLSNSIDAEVYIREEFDWIRSALVPTKRHRYIEIPRTGRKFPLLKDARVEILKSLVSWEKKMRDIGIIDYLGVCSSLFNFKDLLKPSFQHIIVDEAQDFGTTELTILKKLSMENDNNIFLCGDIAQSVLPKHRSLKSAGIHLKGGKEKLTKNYRNTRQILEVAYNVLLNNLPADQFSLTDDSMEILDPKYANRSLNKPVILKAESLAEELSYAKKMMEGLGLANANHTGCIVIAGYKQSEIKQFSKLFGLRSLDGSLDPFSEQIVMSDIEQSKGYEFDTVVLVNCEDKILPPLGTPFDELYRIACQLYVSMTRAKNDLYISYHNKLSDWLTDIDGFEHYNWKDVEKINKNDKLLIPEKIHEIYEQERNSDIFFGMNGEEFIYSKFAIGLSITHQEKLLELVDGLGLINSNTRENIRWRDIRSAVDSIKISHNARKLFGPNLSDKIISVTN